MSCLMNQNSPKKRACTFLCSKSQCMAVLHYRMLWYAAVHVWWQGTLRCHYDWMHITHRSQVGMKQWNTGLSSSLSIMDTITHPARQAPCSPVLTSDVSVRSMTQWQGHNLHCLWAPQGAMPGRSWMCNVTLPITAQTQRGGRCPS